MRLYCNGLVILLLADCYVLLIDIQPGVTHNPTALFQSVVDPSVFPHNITTFQNCAFRKTTIPTHWTAPEGRSMTYSTESQPWRFLTGGAGPLFQYSRPLLSLMVHRDSQYNYDGVGPRPQKRQGILCCLNYTPGYSPRITLYHRAKTVIRFSVGG